MNCNLPNPINNCGQNDQLLFSISQPSKFLLFFFALAFYYHSLNAQNFKTGTIPGIRLSLNSLTDDQVRILYNDVPLEFWGMSRNVVNIPEIQNLTNERAFDFFGVQRPVRASYIKTTT
ncbi:MAG: hypothetical protein AAF600_06565 [Bacteroidota bacterium]